MKGQYELFAENEKNKGLGDPCEHCNVQWGSLQCFLRRGYIWTYSERFERMQVENA